MVPGRFHCSFGLTPTLLYWCLGDWWGLRDRAFQFLAMILALAAVLYFIFVVPRAGYSPVVLYAPVPFLVLAATRFRPIGVSTAISVLALVSTVSTVEGKGPFVSNHSHVVLFMQLFLAVISVPMLFVAILIEERHTVESALRESRAVLKESYERTQDLASKLLRAQEDERRRIARELHDDIGQRVSLLSVGMDKLSQEYPPKTESERTLAESLLRETQDLATNVHDLSHQLHSTTLQHMGLEAAIKGLCRTIERQQNIAIEFQSDRITGLSEEIDLCLFRVAQEALNNAVRHGRAKHIDISLRKQEKVLWMKIRDTGIGFDPAIVSNGLGFVSMQERLRFLGGRVVVSSQPGGGTEVNAELPLREAA